MEILERHVSIIFFADIVGYTMMMQKNEQNALLKLTHYEEAIQSASKKYDGEIIKAYGDGSLLLFSSAIKAINCAIDIQNSLRREPKVPLRIGIHIGEIVRKDHDIFGNGVNIASRIESMGIANSVLISSDVYLQIKNHPEFKIHSLGSFKFKNVERDIELYAIGNDELTIPLLKEMKGKGEIKAPKSILSQWKLGLITILIITGFSFIFKYNFSNPVHVNNELSSNLEAVNFFLKGDFHKNKETLLDIDKAIVYYQKAIDKDSTFAKAYSMLASTYMRKFLSFDPNTSWEKEAYTLAGTALILDPNLVNPHIIKGQFYWSQSHNFAHEEAMNEFNKAIKKDENSSEAYEQLALVQLHIGLFEEALTNARKSILLKPDNYRARRFVAETLLFQGEYQSAIKEFEKIPDNFAALPTKSFEALNLYYLNQKEAAINLIEEKLINNPNNTNLNSVYAIVLASNKQYDEAKLKMEIALTNSRDFIHAHHIYHHLGIAYALMNENKDAVLWLKKATVTGFPNYPLIKSDPSLSNLQGDPDYEELLIELKEKWDYFKSL